MAQALAGYAAEIRLIEQHIAEAGGVEALNEPADTERVTRYVYRLYQRASLAGDPTGLSAVARAIDRAIPLLAHPGDLCLLKANVAFKLHQFANVQSALRAVPSVYDSDEGRLIRADLDFQLGRYQTAKIRYCAVLKTERSWGALARLAYFCGKMGNPAGADELYEEAQDDLTAKEMRAFAWLEVQRGFLDFAHGRYREAQSHYDRADEAYPGYWLVDEHVAELLAAQDQYADAIAILEGIVSTAHRPELDQAIGELYQRTGQEERARQQMQKALTAYLESVRSGEVHYWHHLADFYADVAKDGSQAVVWARRDLQLRVNFSTQAALAWASYRDGRFAEARDWIDRALSSGVATAHLFSQAGRIYAAAGLEAEAQDLLGRAMILNPMVDKFHLHH
jgi:tetratricopeptide (TPR) repeat protein